MIQWGLPPILSHHARVNYEAIMKITSRAHSGYGIHTTFFLFHTPTSARKGASKTTWWGWGGHQEKYGPQHEDFELVVVTSIQQKWPLTDDGLDLFQIMFLMHGPDAESLAKICGSVPWSQKILTSHSLVWLLLGDPYVTSDSEIARTAWHVPRTAYWPVNSHARETRCCLEAHHTQPIL